MQSNKTVRRSLPKRQTDSRDSQITVAFPKIGEINRLPLSESVLQSHTQYSFLSRNNASNINQNIQPLNHQARMQRQNNNSPLHIQSTEHKQLIQLQNKQSLLQKNIVEMKQKGSLIERQIQELQIQKRRIKCSKQDIGKNICIEMNQIEKIQKQMNFVQKKLQYERYQSNWLKNELNVRMYQDMLSDLRINYKRSRQNLQNMRNEANEDEDIKRVNNRFDKINSLIQAKQQTLDEININMIMLQQKLRVIIKQKTLILLRITK